MVTTTKNKPAEERPAEHCPHGLTAEDVAANAAAAAELMGAHVGTCQCCGGPSPKWRVSTPDGEPLQWVEFPYCGACNEGMSYAAQIGHLMNDASEWGDDTGFVEWAEGQAARSMAVAA